MLAAEQVAELDAEVEREIAAAIAFAEAAPWPAESEAFSHVYA